MSDEPTKTPDDAAPAGEDDEALGAEAIEDLLTYLQFQHCPDPWLEAIEGRRSIDDAARAAGEQGEDEAWIEPSRVLFAPRTPLEQARLRRSLVDRYGRASSWGSRAWWLAPLAVAAALWLVLAWPGSGPGDRGGEPEVVASLRAAYAVELHGHGSMRAPSEASDEVVRVHEDYAFELVAQPDRRVTEAVELGVFARRPEGAWVRLPVTVEPGIGGRMTASTSARELGLGPGRWALLLLVGPAGGIESDPAALAARADGSPDPRGVQVFHRALEVESGEATTASIDIETRGCTASGPFRCIVEPGQTLRLWIEDPRARAATVRINGLPVEATAYGPRLGPAAADGSTAAVGVGLRVVVPEAGSEAYARLAALGGAHWVLSVEHPDRGSSSLPLTVGPMPGASPAARAARVEIRHHWQEASRANAAARWEQSLEHRMAALSLARAHRHWSWALDNGVAAYFLLGHQLGREDEADRLLSQLEPLLAHDPTRRRRLRYYQGLAAQRGGRTTLAAQHLLHAVRPALGLEDEALVSSALPMFVHVLIDLGHYAAARHWLQAAVQMSAEYDACRRADVLHNLGWASVLLQELGEPGLDGRALLGEARALKEGPACAAGHRRASTTIALALASLAGGDPEGAAEDLEGLGAAALTDHQRVWAAWARLRIALARAPPEAGAALPALAAATAAHPTPEARWRLALAQAQVEHARGDVDAAIEAYGRAEHELDQMVEGWALGTAHDLFMAQRLASARGLVRLLVEDGRSDQALCAARRARARSLWSAIPAALDEPTRARLDGLRARYAEQRAAQDQRGRALRSLPVPQRASEQRRLDRARRALGEALRQELERIGVRRAALDCDGPVDPEQTTLAIFPVSTQQWAVFVADAAGVAAAIVQAEALRERPQEVLDGFRAPLERAGRIRVIAAGEATALPVHMLHWQGQPLMARTPVVYAADLPPRPEAPGGRSPGRRAVLVEDPTGTVRAQARPELDRAAAELEGWAITRLRGDEASTSAVLGALDRSDLFHFAGHGAADSGVAPDWPSLAGGSPGWSTHLVLGQGSRLEVLDVLHAGRVPATVVLSGCSTGVMDPRSPAGGMSLAMAFLLAGSERVVASTEPVDSEQARRVVAALYRSGAVLGPARIDPGAASSRAWSSMRIWVR